MSRYLDVPALVSWLGARQYAPEGGFSGRTNKLVDGCYSHWVGACWPLIAAALKPSYALSRSAGDRDVDGTGTQPNKIIKQTTLFDREGLIRYILCACQDTSRRGGMRDKPNK